MGKFIDITGQKFGRLKVDGFSHIDKHKDARWNCTCECGSIVIIRGSPLRKGFAKSCGCLMRELASMRFEVHGETKPYTPEYKAWKAMKRRCSSKSPHFYKYYAARGITVCERWLSGDGQKSGFECFLEDMGRKPDPKSTIDRINNDLGYSPGNCRWATKQQQANNTSCNRYITHLGRTQTIGEWACELGMKYATLRNRIRHGWSIERLFAPVSNKPLPLVITWNGRTQRLPEWVPELGLSYNILVQRLSRGWSVDRAFTQPVRKPRVKSESGTRDEAQLELPFGMPA